METQFDILGKFFGYPKCCVKAFNNFMSFIERPQVVQIANQTVDGCGFVPCEECAKKVVTGKITLHSLIKNRICETPFPIDDTNNTMKYLEAYYEKN